MSEAKTRIRILGAGWYGCHLGLAMQREDRYVEVHECAPYVFSGASGANPARLHEGFHYPRSRITRAFCQQHKESFMRHYGHLTRHVPINIYAVAAEQSLVDFGTYAQILTAETDLIPVYSPEEFGLQNVEGAVMTGERHVVISAARTFFTEALRDTLRVNTPASSGDERDWDWTIDCTFCALAPVDVDRYEPCITGLLSGPVDKAVTIMDGKFPSIYPWDELTGICSITSALYTPFDKCATWTEANSFLQDVTDSVARARVEAMRDQMEYFWPMSKTLYETIGWKCGIRATPRSAADARVVDVVQVGDRVLRVRAGKIDAVFQAHALIEDILKC